MYIDLSLGRTGTSSRTVAAQMLGIKPTVHYPDINYFPQKPWSYTSDSIWSVRAKELLPYYGDKVKFLYVIRDLEDWLASWDKHDAKLRRSGAINSPKLKAHRIAIYGQDKFDSEVWSTVWKSHQDYVFSLPESQTYILHYWFPTNDEWKWSMFGNFLNVIPNVRIPFPHINKS